MQSDRRTDPLRKPDDRPRVLHEVNLMSLFSCRSRLAALAIVTATFALASPAFAGSDEQFLRGTFPQKWIDPLMPEDLPALTYPAYFNDLDKARLESSTGRYKLSLSTLRRLKDPKPEQLAEIAVIKSTSQGALGRWDEALQTTQEPKV